MGYELVGSDYDAGVGDDIQDMVDAVSGEYEVGATPARRKIVRARPSGGGQGGGGPAGSPMFGRQKGELRKRSALGFGAFSVATLAQATLTARVQRAFHPDRLLIITSASGLLLMSLRIGDEEQLLNPGVSAEAYGKEALSDTRTDDFTPAASGMDLSILIYNPSGATITGSATMKGLVLR